MTDSTPGPSERPDGPTHNVGRTSAPAEMPAALRILGDQLVAAAERRAESAAVASLPKRPTHDAARRTLAAVAAAAVLVIGGVAAWVTIDGPQVAADVKIERSGDRLTVSIDDDVDPQEIRDALEAAGVDATVTEQSTGPSGQSKFVGISSPADARLGDGREARGSPVSATASFSVGSRVELFVGGPARGNEPYDVPTIATEPGEPFAGRTLIGRTVGAARTDLESGPPDVNVEYRDKSGQPTERIADDALISGAQRTSATTVLIFTR